MGVDFSASVIVGVRLSDFCEVREVETTETRYHERTGAPYEKKVARKAVFILGVEVPGLDPSPSEWEKTLGLRVFDCDDRYERRRAPDLTKCVMGVEVVDSNSHRHNFNPLTAIQTQAVDEATEAVVNVLCALRDRLKSLGTTVGSLPFVQQFLLASVSC